MNLNKDNLLTIVIPTFNRINIVLANISNIIDNKINKLVDILIIDNNSPDGTAKTLIEKYSSVEGVTILKNQTNIGFAGNFLSISEHCKTDYFLVTSDEDFIIKENLINLIDFLQKNNPVFLRPQVFMNEKMYCGKRKTEDLGVLGSIESSFYISGLVYRGDTVASVVSLINLEDYFSYLYPQIVLTLLVQAYKGEDVGKSLFWNKPVTVKKFTEETYILTKDDNPYWLLGSRWEQAKSLFQITENLINSDVDTLDKKVIKDFQFAYFSNLYENFNHAVSIESPGIYKIVTSKKALINNQLRFYKRSVSYVIRKILNRHA